MEAATEQFIARKSFLNNESGNILVVFSLMALIAGSVGYWISITSKVDKEIIGLGASQASSYLRSDFQNTIKKALQGRLTITTCPLKDVFQNSFYNFLNSDPRIEKSYQDNPVTTNINEIISHPEIKCFFNPSRYDVLKWEKIKILIQRSGEPNLISLSNFLNVEVTAAYKINEIPRSHKFKIKYRLDVLTLNHFGLIFKNSSSPMIDLQNDSKLKINSSVLFDLPTRINSTIPLEHILKLPDFQRLAYHNEVYTPAASFSINDDAVSFLSTQSLGDVFKKGVQYNSLPKDLNFKMPYELAPSEWSEIIDMSPITKDGYPLPFTTPPSIILNELDKNNSITFNPSFDKRSTNSVYKKMYQHQTRLFESCSKEKILNSGIYPLHLFNNLNEDFEIDFSGNNSKPFIPVFCGVIAAKNLTIILNNEPTTSNYFQHHLIGKFILSGQLIVKNNGKLNIHDISEFNGDQYDYNIDFPIDVQNLRTQFYNQKYYSTQNFFLPVFKPNKYPLNATNSVFYVPRSTKSLFSKIENINGQRKMARNDIITSPPPEDLIQQQYQNLVFEVFDAE